GSHTGALSPKLGPWRPRYVCLRYVWSNFCARPTQTLTAQPGNRVHTPGVAAAPTRWTEQEPSVHQPNTDQPSPGYPSDPMLVLLAECGLSVKDVAEPEGRSRPGASQYRECGDGRTRQSGARQPTRKCVRGASKHLRDYLAGSGTGPRSAGMGLAWGHSF